LNSIIYTLLSYLSVVGLHLVGLLQKYHGFFYKILLREIMYNNYNYVFMKIIININFGNIDCNTPFNQ